MTLEEIPAECDAADILWCDSMMVCGVDLKGSEAILALVSAKDGSLTFVDCETKRISLGDDKDGAALRAFVVAVESFIKEHSVSAFIIKSRAQRGKMAGGAVSFKMEALLQTIVGVECQFVNPVAVSGYVKRGVECDGPRALAYQEGALYSALYYLSR